MYADEIGAKYSLSEIENPWSTQMLFGDIFAVKYILFSISNRYWEDNLHCQIKIFEKLLQIEPNRIGTNNSGSIPIITQT